MAGAERGKAEPPGVRYRRYSGASIEKCPWYIFKIKKKRERSIYYRTKDRVLQLFVYVYVIYIEK